MAVQAPLGGTAIWCGGQDDIPCLRNGIFVRARQVLKNHSQQLCNDYKYNFNTSS